MKATIQSTSEIVTVDGKRASLAELLGSAPAATDVRVDNCPGLTVLPDLPAATVVWVDNCPGLTAGKDSRGYAFLAARIRNQWRILAGCRNFSIDEARKHWGPGGRSDRPDCLALVQVLASAITARAAQSSLPADGE